MCLRMLFCFYAPGQALFFVEAGLCPCLCVGIAVIEKDPSPLEVSPPFPGVPLRLSQ